MLKYTTIVNAFSAKPIVLEKFQEIGILELPNCTQLKNRQLHIGLVIHKQLFMETHMRILLG